MTIAPDVTIGDQFAYLLETDLAPPPAREVVRVGGRFTSLDGKGNDRAEWDWYYQLSESDRTRYRMWMRPRGCQPDEWAQYMGYSDVEHAMREWCTAVDAQRKVGEWDDFGEEPETRLVECSDEQWAVISAYLTGETMATDYITLQEIAELSGLTPGSLNVYKSRGTLPLPIRKFGSTPVWERSTIVEWIACRPGVGRPRRPLEPIVVLD